MLIKPVSFITPNGGPIEYLTRVDITVQAYSSVANNWTGYPKGAIEDDFDADGGNPIVPPQDFEGHNDGSTGDGEISTRTFDLTGKNISYNDRGFYRFGSANVYRIQTISTYKDGVLEDTLSFGNTLQSPLGSAGQSTVAGVNLDGTVFTKTSVIYKNYPKTYVP